MKFHKVSGVIAALFALDAAAAPLRAGTKRGVDTTDIKTARAADNAPRGDGITPFVVDKREGADRTYTINKREGADRTYTINKRDGADRAYTINKERDVEEVEPRDAFADFDGDHTV